MRPKTAKPQHERPSRAARWLVVACAAAFAAPGPLHADAFEDGVLAELNRVRADPQTYARELRRDEVARGDRSGPPADEDPKAAAEAVNELSRERPLPLLSADPSLAAAARAHVARQGPTGEVGHGPPGSLRQRLRSEGFVARLVGESISYGERTPRAVVRQLIVDSGVPDRAHRKILLDRGYQAAGVACGRHAEYGSMCVIDLAGAIVRR